MTDDPGLSPEALRALLNDAVAPIQPSGHAYQRIRDTIESRRRFRFRWVYPLTAVGFAALVGVIVLSVVLVQQTRGSSGPTIAEPPGGITVTTPGTSGGGAAATGHNNGGTSPGGSQNGQTSSGPTTGPSTAGTSSDPSVATSSPPPDGKGNTRPTPVAKPAAPGDVDGDGARDTISVGASSLSVAFTRGGRPGTVQLPAGVTDHYAAVDLDHDGFAEIVIQTGMSNGVASYTVVRYTAQGVLSAAATPPVATPPQPVQLGAGISTDGKSGWGFRCGDDGTLELLSGAFDEGGQAFTTTTVTARLGIDDWVKVRSDRSILTPEQAREKFVADCDGL